MTLIPSLSPCPFCGSHLMILGPSRAQHPPADCILSGREIAAREFREWNKRAEREEACQLCSCTAAGALRQIEAGLAFIAADDTAEEAKMADRLLTIARAALAKGEKV